MADWHGMVGKLGRVDGYSRRRNEEFEEDDVWSVVKEVEDSSTPKNHYNSFSSSSPSASHLLASAPRMIPRTHINNNNNNSSPTKQESKKVGIQQCSAPLNIPDWSKIYGRNSRMGSSWIDDDDGYDDDVDGHGHDDGDDGMIPPHDWIAMKLARSQISSFSVYEGIGRTLKGRDLSKVRNAILTKTGFLE